MKYCYDGSQVIAEYDGSDTLLRKFIYGPGIDEPICMIDVADSNALYYYHRDGLGSVIALSDTNNDIAESYSYDVFGAPTIYDAAATEIAQSAVANPYMFTGRRLDEETALYYYRARYYAPTIGRFLQTDPIGYADGLNWYLYCGNDPLNWIDPYGLLSKENSSPDEGWLNFGNFFDFDYDFGIDNIRDSGFDDIRLGNNRRHNRDRDSGEHFEGIERKFYWQGKYKRGSEKDDWGGRKYMPKRVEGIGKSGQDDEKQLQEKGRDALEGTSSITEVGISVLDILTRVVMIVPRILTSDYWLEQDRLRKEQQQQRNML